MTDTIAAEFQDQMVQIFASYGTTGYLYVVLDFAAPLDADVVRQATRRLLDAEPVLGCRFDEGGAVEAGEILVAENVRGLAGAGVDVVTLEVIGGVGSDDLGQPAVAEPLLKRYGAAPCVGLYILLKREAKADRGRHEWKLRLPVRVGGNVVAIEEDARGRAQVLPE